METSSNLEIEKFIRIRWKGDLIRVIIEDENSQTYVMMLDKSKYQNIDVYLAHVLKLLRRQNTNSNMLLLKPHHKINDINILQTNDELLLTNTAHYNILISERKSRELQSYKETSRKWKNDDTSDTAPGFLNSNNFSYSVAPLPLSRDVPKVLQSSEQDINKQLEWDQSGKIGFITNSVMTNFDLSQVDIRDIMESDKLIEEVKASAWKMGVKVKFLTSNGSNSIIFSWQELGCKFKLIYRKYDDERFMLYGAIMAHSHVPIIETEIQNPEKDDQNKSTSLKDLPWNEENENSMEFIDNDETFQHDLTNDIAKDSMNRILERNLKTNEDDISDNQEMSFEISKDTKFNRKENSKQSNSNLQDENINQNSKLKNEIKADSQMDEEFIDTLELLVEQEDYENEESLIKKEQLERSKIKHSKYNHNPYDEINKTN